MNDLIDGMTDDELVQLKNSTARALRERTGVSDGVDSSGVPFMSDSEFEQHKSRVFASTRKAAHKRRIESEAREIIEDGE